MLNRGLFALFSWTLKRDTQLGRTHIVRGGIAGVMLLVLVFGTLQSLSVVGAAGLNLFESICWINIVVSTLAAISYFSTTVTEESEAGNLGLLKLAGLGAFSILLAKSTSRLVSALMLLIVQFPFTLLAITLGGITLTQIIASYVAIGAHLILVANLALFCSVFCQSSGRAAVCTGLVVAAFFASAPFLSYALPAAPPQSPGWLETWAETYEELSVINRIDDALAPAFAGSFITAQVLFSVGAAGLLYAGACLGFEWGTQRQGVPQRAALARGRRRLSRVFGVSRVWKMAIAWKEFNFLAGGRVMWVARVAAFSVFSAVVWYYVQPIGNDDWRMVSQFLAAAAAGFAAIELVVYSSRIVFDEVRWRTLSLLLILPVSVRQIMTQKVIGCLLAILPALFWLVLAIGLDPASVLATVQAGVLLHVLVNSALLLHFTVLLSLYVKWAALPIATCVVLVFNMCCPVMSIGLVVNDVLGDRSGLLLLVISLLTYWILLLLPLEVEIVSRIADAEAR